MAQHSVGFMAQDAPELVALSKMRALDLSNIDLSAAADYQNFGALLTPQFEREINDIARRRGVFGQLLDMQQGPATGHPHRWFDQYVLPNTGAFQDPRAINPAAANNGTTLRTEFAANVRALTGQINFGLFDQQVNAQSSIFPQLVAKDLKDMISAVLQAEDLGLFTGTASTLVDGGSVQFCALKTQVTNTIQINPGASIIDGIRTKIAVMMASITVVVKPTHIFVNPILLDLVEQEVKNSANTMKTLLGKDVEVVPGVEVTSIRTAAGILPLVPCWEMASRASTVPGATTDYPVFIASMNLIEKGWIGAPGIQLFKLGLVNDLADKYIGVSFNTGAIVKAAGTAHAYGYVSR